MIAEETVELLSGRSLNAPATELCTGSASTPRSDVRRASASAMPTCSAPIWCDGTGRLAPSKGGNGLRILLVEDNLMHQVLGEALVESLGFSATIASDGIEAVHRWSAEPFDLILMDCHMPVMDGFAATRRIRQGELERGIAARTPILALTGCWDGDERECCIKAGMDAVLMKPFSPDELLAFVNDRGTQVQASLPHEATKLDAVCQLLS